MQINQDGSKQWPQWARVINKVSGYLFVALLFVFLAKFVLRYIFFIRIEDIKPWMVIGWELLTVLIILQQISRVWHQGKSFYRAALSILLSLFAIFSVLVAENLIRENESLTQQTRTLTEYIMRLSDEVSYLSDIINKLDPTILKPPTVDPTLPPVTNAPGGPSDVSSSPANSFVLYTTAITGLVTALSGFYGQIISARKAKTELEIQKLKLELEQKKEEPQKPKKQASKNQRDRLKTKKPQEQLPKK